MNALEKSKQRKQEKEIRKSLAISNPKLINDYLTSSLPQSNSESKPNSSVSSFNDNIKDLTDEKIIPENNKTGMNALQMAKYRKSIKLNKQSIFETVLKSDSPKATSKSDPLHDRARILYPSEETAGNLPSHTSTNNDLDNQDPNFSDVDNLKNYQQEPIIPTISDPLIETTNASLENSSGENNFRPQYLDEEDYQSSNDQLPSTESINQPPNSNVDLITPGYAESSTRRASKQDINELLNYESELDFKDRLSLNSSFSGYNSYMDYHNISNSPKDTYVNAIDLFKTGKNKPIVKIFFEAYCNDELEMDGDSLQSLGYDLGYYLELEEVKRILSTNSSVRKKRSLTYEDFLIYWRSNRFFCSIRLTDPMIKRRIHVASVFRAYDPLNQGFVKQSVFTDSIYKSLVKDNYLNKRNKVEDLIKKIDPFNRGKIEMSRFIEYLDQNIPPLPMKRSTIYRLWDTFSPLRGRGSSFSNEDEKQVEKEPISTPLTNIMNSPKNHIPTNPHLLKRLSSTNTPDTNTTSKSIPRDSREASELFKQQNERIEKVPNLEYQREIIQETPKEIRRQSSILKSDHSNKDQQNEFPKKSKSVSISDNNEIFEINTSNTSSASDNIIIESTVTSTQIPNLTFLSAELPHQEENQDEKALKFHAIYKAEEARLMAELDSLVIEEKEFIPIESIPQENIPLIPETATVASTKTTFTSAITTTITTTIPSKELPPTSNPVKDQTTKTVPRKSKFFLKKSSVRMSSLSNETPKPVKKPEVSFTFEEDIKVQPRSITPVSQLFPSVAQENFQSPIHNTPSTSNNSDFINPLSKLKTTRTNNNDSNNSSKLSNSQKVSYSVLPIQETVKPKTELNLYEKSNLDSSNRSLDIVTNSNSNSNPSLVPASTLSAPSLPSPKLEIKITEKRSPESISAKSPKVYVPPKNKPCTNQFSPMKSPTKIKVFNAQVPIIRSESPIKRTNLPTENYVPVNLTFEEDIISQDWLSLDHDQFLKNIQSISTNLFDSASQEIDSKEIEKIDLKIKELATHNTCSESIQDTNPHILLQEMYREKQNIIHMTRLIKSLFEVQNKINLHEEINSINRIIETAKEHQILFQEESQVLTLSRNETKRQIRHLHEECELKADLIINYQQYITQQNQQTREQMEFYSDKLKKEITNIQDLRAKMKKPIAMISIQKTEIQDILDHKEIVFDALNDFKRKSEEFLYRSSVENRLKFESSELINSNQDSELLEDDVFASYDSKLPSYLNTSYFEAKEECFVDDFNDENEILEIDLSQPEVSLYSNNSEKLVSLLSLTSPPKPNVSFTKVSSALLLDTKTPSTPQTPSPFRSPPSRNPETINSDIQSKLNLLLDKFDRFTNE